ncbi:MAG: response regulator, partial [Syntrophales bacterium]|nr:response regulator [Syntrophales bacterium]
MENYSREGAKARILVVDDERPVREMMCDLLSDGTTEVAVAEGAEDALAQVAAVDFDVVLLDLKLFGMNGIELCRQIRAQRPLTILYAMTGWTGLFEVEECREAGFDDYFTKPIKNDTLI